MLQALNKHSTSAIAQDEVRVGSLGADSSPADFERPSSTASYVLNHEESRVNAC